jgi:hypothetical protein
MLSTMSILVFREDVVNSSGCCWCFRRDPLVKSSESSAWGEARIGMWGLESNDKPLCTPGLLLYEDEPEAGWPSDWKGLRGVLGFFGAVPGRLESNDTPLRTREGRVQERVSDTVLSSSRSSSSETNRFGTLGLASKDDCLARVSGREDSPESPWTTSFLSDNLGDGRFGMLGVESKEGCLVIFVGASATEIGVSTANRLGFKRAFSTFVLTANLSPAAPSFINSYSPKGISETETFSLNEPDLRVYETGLLDDC